MRRKQVPVMHRASVEVHRIGSMGKRVHVWTLIALGGLVRYREQMICHFTV